MEELEYGKVITEETIVAGKTQSTSVKYSVSRKVLDRAQALSQVIKALELITTRQTTKLEFIIEADPKTGHFDRIVKTYLVERK